MRQLGSPVQTATCARASTEACSSKRSRRARAPPRRPTATNPGLAESRCYRPRRCCARRGTNSSFTGCRRFCGGSATPNSGLAKTRCYRPRRCCARRGADSFSTGRCRFRGGPATPNSGLAETRCYRPRRCCARRGTNSFSTGRCRFRKGSATSATRCALSGSGQPLSACTSYAILVVPCPTSSPPSAARSGTFCHTQEATELSLRYLHPPTCISSFPPSFPESPVTIGLELRPCFPAHTCEHTVGISGTVTAA